METINLQIEQFKSNVLDLINNSKLPVAVVYYIFKDIQRDLDEVYSDALRREANAAQALVPEENGEPAPEQVNDEVIDY